jgi:hypothetical protein
MKTVKNTISLETHGASNGVMMVTLRLLQSQVLVFAEFSRSQPGQLLVENTLSNCKRRILRNED